MGQGVTDLDQRLDNWGRALRAGTPRGRAMSFEGNYRSPQRNHWEIPVSSMRGSIDVQDAWKIETAWGSLPYFDRILLRGHYCLKWTPRHICRVAANETGIVIRYWYIDAHIANAKLLLERAIGRTDDQNRNILRQAVKKTLALVTGWRYKLA